MDVYFLLWFVVITLSLVAASLIVMRVASSKWYMNCLMKATKKSMETLFDKDVETK
jgi:hypothetical protein